MPWWAVVWVAVMGGGWVRGALRTRHSRRMERLAFEERRRAEIEAAGKAPEPVCGCTHHLAKHDKQGRCHETVEVPAAWDRERKPLSYESRPCACQQYVGPQPLATYYAEQITDPDLV
ncbi:hypothetical protein GTW54_16095 [Streptomyces sp. SID5468]|nr:hypothetical protein [Streptomyces sp. SID5468]